MSDKDTNSEKIKTSPFQAENQNLTTEGISQSLFQNLTTIKGITVLGRDPCCPPCFYCRKRQYFSFPIFNDDTTSKQSISITIDMTECCTKFCYSHISTAGLTLEVLENKKQIYSGIIKPNNKCCRNFCVCFYTCCPGMLPMIINSNREENISLIEREKRCCKYHVRTILDKEGTPKYIIDPSKCECRRICCNCLGCYCCCCCGSEGCCSCEDRFIVPIGSFGNGDDGVLIRRVKFCPPCKRPTFDIIFPKGANQEMRVALLLAAIELDYFGCFA